jgi:hypothetical protein
MIVIDDGNMSRHHYAGMEAKKSVLKNGVLWDVTRATRRNIPEDAIPHSHRRENLNSYEICSVRPTWQHI